MDPMHATLCTQNQHKVEELRSLLPEWLALRSLPAKFVMPDETGSTFLENARIKAQAGRAADASMWSIADDSGLCVAAFDGAPGVHSARFAGANATDAENNAKLLTELDQLGAISAEDRRAHFACVLVAITPDGKELVAEGKVEGHIAMSATGNQGFGYDPLFIPDGYDESFSVLGDAIKSKLSHRARAAEALALQLVKAGTPAS